MLEQITRLYRRIAGRANAQSNRLVFDDRPDPEAYPAIVIDYSGEGMSVAGADAQLTLVEPGATLDAATLLARSGLAPAAWALCGVGALPYSLQATADFVVEFCRQAAAPVYVLGDGLADTARARFVAHLRRSAARARRQRLSPRVRVLSSGRNARWQPGKAEAPITTVPSSSPTHR
jgi:hypothetical protein